MSRRFSEITHRVSRVLGGLVAILVASLVQAGEVQVAVASNFAGPFQALSKAFTAETGHTAVMVSGSTGKFHVQIQSGAPFEVLLAADDETPRKLVAEGLAAGSTQFTYAKGRLVLWSSQAGMVDPQGAALKQGGFDRLAIANPRLAPYGAAAMEVLTTLNLADAVRGKLVQGENIAQTYQFVASGNASLGFVALSQVAPPGKPMAGSMWLVPEGLYSPIRQDAVLLNKGQGNAAAAALMAFLKGEKAQALIRAYGYGL